ncbi:hypothetical protein D9758_001004 [Tetrapyrgos nigripes]|uniref:Glutathione S-transferase UstS-like C-terminal domain-containing protein n=1 Tax=Tetrapyrgos nigripes TaxID=182062 RepID=A0A8H5C0F9_9AGAR|nr:hypothetical protein D9758_017369 [Tetrapyrgos nigripes]KAF5373922.1 hypothetical protein D9758_001004 [Tetrapyrgos nigripes]
MGSKWAPRDLNEEMTEESVEDSWKRFESRFGELAKTIGDGPFVMGNQISFLDDCALIGWLMLLRFTLWDDDKGKQWWNEIMEWHGADEKG